jgi:hypothetical protein
MARLNAYPDWEIPTKVITTIPAGDRQKATVLVRIGFKELDPRILPDMGVKVGFLGGPVRGSSSTIEGVAGATQPAPRPVALVPAAAIVKDGESTYAFVVNGEVVERRAITVGGKDGDRTEVIGGLKPRERVVLSPPPTLAAGMKVVTKPR